MISHFARCIHAGCWAQRCIIRLDVYCLVDTYQVIRTRILWNQNADVLDSMARVRKSASTNVSGSGTKTVAALMPAIGGGEAGQNRVNHHTIRAAPCRQVARKLVHKSLPMH